MILNECALNDLRHHAAPRPVDSRVWYLQMDKRGEGEISLREFKDALLERWNEHEDSLKPALHAVRSIIADCPLS